MERPEVSIGYGKESAFSSKFNSCTTYPLGGHVGLGYVSLTCSWDRNYTYLLLNYLIPLIVEPGSMA